MQTLRRTTLIANPRSGPLDVQGILPRVVERLRARGWRVGLHFTERAGDVRRLAAEARDRGDDAVLVAGGDGSLNEAVNALAGSEVALGAIPSGTANVWARQIGLPVPEPSLPDALLGAAEALADGSVRTVDLGRAGDRLFLLWSGIGLDAEVTASIEPKPWIVRRLGIPGYALHAAAVALRYRGRLMTVDIDDRRIQARALLVVVSNAPLYSPFLRLAPDAVLDDGLLDVAVFRGAGAWATTRHLLRLLREQALGGPGVIHARGRRFRVTAQTSCHVQVDGEPLGRTPVEVEVVPGALRVLVPRGVPATLFRERGAG